MLPIRFLQDLGDMQVAKWCYERALTIFGVKLGKNHPNTKLIETKLK